jgi:hypothetical protein
MILGLHFAGDVAFLPTGFGIEMGNASRTRFARNQVRPAGFDIPAQWCDKAKPGDDDTTHAIISNLFVLPPITAKAGQKANGFPALNMPESRSRISNYLRIAAPGFNRWRR